MEPSMGRRLIPHPYALRVGQRIEALYKQRGLTLVAFAKRMANSKGHLSNVIRGLAMPTIETIRQIAETLEVHPGALFPEESVRGELVDRISRLPPKRCEALVLGKKRPKKRKAKASRTHAPRRARVERRAA
jgi:transcriptional regulator with XRE-family HTH domain